MSIIHFEALQDTLDGRTVGQSDLHGPYLRLLDAWKSDRAGRDIQSDVLGLISQILRHQQLTTVGPIPSLDLALEARGISVDAADSFGLKPIPLHGGKVRLEPAEHWEPEWLHGDPRWVDHAIASPREIVLGTGKTVSTEARHVTEAEELPADPAVSAVAPGMKRYMSPAQATALRAVGFAETGSTLHIVLPTGSGKSLVGLVPGLIEPGSTTVVVVPTIALAMDQERQSRTRFTGASLPPELAYHGERSAEEKRAIRERLASGTQRLLFTSPESLVHSLAPQLRELAERGGLSYVVIDEAHLVYSWGLDFRPEFQLAASLVRELRLIAREHGRAVLKTVLMTATLSGEALRLNDALFSEGRSIFVGSTYLRTELRYLMSDCESTETREQRLVEAMRHLPKPAIVYTTKREDADHLAEVLRTNGFGRTEAFHGEVAGRKRNDILGEWSGADRPTSVDIIVGTTAFGVGVDQSDVRTVVHACIPRSVDRFYQEVGRGGRDGHSAVSLWLPNPNTDFRDSRVEIPRLIGQEKGWNRWKAMRNRATIAPEESAYAMTIDLRTVPSHNDIDNEYNRLWNRNLVTVLRHAGVIDIAPVHPPSIRRAEGESDADWELRLSNEWDKFRTHLDIIATGSITSLDEEGFEQAFSKVRKTVHRREEGSFARIRRLLALEECWGEILAEEYTLHEPDILGAEQRPGPSCSGCPARNHTRSPEDPPARAKMTRPAFPEVPNTLMPALLHEMMGRQALLITYDSTSTSTIGRAVTAAVNNGITQVCYSKTLRPALVENIVRATGSRKLVAVEEIDLRRPLRKFALPTLVVTAGNDPVGTTLVEPSADAVPRLVLVPVNSPAPTRPHLSLEDVVHPNMQITEFVRRL
ncbi:protein DpdF [Rhodococcus wratislaviensis]|uniref:protein DpdF n=1 Tax=Rhodococcus wratislaviensis TaxID=44752 RepID=UPI0004B72E5E|nr:protein DpdF [Rhodococcus wratislaviensis]